MGLWAFNVRGVGAVIGKPIPSGFMQRGSPSAPELLGSPPGSRVEGQAFRVSELGNPKP